MRRLRALIRKEFTHIRRDPRTLTFILIMPILQLFLLGYATNSDVKNVPTVVFDQDNSHASRALLDAYRAAGYFSLDYIAYSEADVTRLIDGGKARVGIIVPPRYSDDLAAGRSSEVAVLIDGSDPTIANTALSAARLVGQSHATNIRFEQLTARGPSMGLMLPFEVRTRVLYNPDLLSSYNMIPGLIGTILQMATMNLTAFAIVRERERGTIEQLIVTPIRNWELIIAKITPYIIISMINVVIVLTVGTLWFKVPIRGSVSLLLALAGLFLLPNLGIGLLISTFARTQQEAQFAVMPIILPAIFLSGFFFPLAAMPSFLQAISRVLPLRYFLVIVRSIVVKGVGIELLLPEIAALCVAAVVMLGIAARRFRKTLD